MKYIVPLIGLLLSVALLPMCRPDTPEPDFFLDGTPRIKSISFSGIPERSVLIDQTTKVISVIMPDTLINETQLSVQLTDNAEWVNKMQSVRSSELFGCDSCSRIELRDKSAASAQVTATYTIRPVASAPLQIAVQQRTIPYSIRNINQTFLEIPVLNLYGNKPPRQARLTSTQTGETTVVWRDSAATFLYPGQKRIQYANYVNRLGIYLYDAKITPGNYQLDLLFDDGRVVKADQLISVSQGTADFTYESIRNLGYTVVAGKTLTVDGYNLFEQDVTLDLLDKQGNVYPLSGLQFDRYGRYVQIPVPSTFSPGQYVMRAYQQDTKLPYGYCLRVNILKEGQERPVLAIGSDVAPCSLIEPIEWQRGSKQTILTNQTQLLTEKPSQRITLKLASTAGNPVYFAEVTPFNPNRGWDVNAAVTLPATMPTGLYAATVQVLDQQNNVVAESEPYGRIVSVK